MLSNRVCVNRGRSNTKNKTESIRRSESWMRVKQKVQLELEMKVYMKVKKKLYSKLF